MQYSRSVLEKIAKFISGSGGNEYCLFLDTATHNALCDDIFSTYIEEKSEPIDRSLLEQWAVTYDATYRVCDVLFHVIVIDKLT